ncbi:lysophosphatidiate acyltransferase [Paragonimus westermani]|uniref:Lysophosphatidiate acyltransferase n=1 Tax=Paragonimus westermani TaxID=34504 RepID=A0A5J4NSN2_9TREM|nr:lysophosphatidiate acyltransferase [Paragonimus westermani]
MTASCKVLNAALGLLSPTMLVLWIIVRLSSFQSIYHYRYLNELLYETFMRVFLFFFEFLTTKKVRNALNEQKSQIFIYGDTEYFKTSGERVIYIANHLSTADWFICSMLIARQRNIGRTRFVMHKNLKYIPIFGFYLAQVSWS